jgi:hypothetical protein
VTVDRTGFFAAGVAQERRVPRVADHAEWLTVSQLPSYSPDLNPQEGIWSLVKRDIGNLAAADLGQITRAVKRKLKMLQYRPEVINGCLAGTGLALDA